MANVIYTTKEFNQNFFSIINLTSDIFYNYINREKNDTKIIKKCIDYFDTFWVLMAQKINPYTLITKNKRLSIGSLFELETQSVCNLINAIGYILFGMQSILDEKNYHLFNPYKSIDLIGKILIPIQ